MNPFDTREMAAGYARYRPPVHQRVIGLARPYLRSAEPIRRALDVGCGAGLSTRALDPLAAEIYGLEPAAGMLAWRQEIAPSAHFVVGAAEALPFARRSIDLLAAAGSLNYAPLERFFPEAARVLSARGLLLVYDYSPGRTFRSGDGLDAWFEEFLRRYPAPASGSRKLNPEILGALDCGFSLRGHSEFAVGLPLAPDFYREYVLTGTNVAAAAGRGVPESEVRAWCNATLPAVWGGGQAREVLFHGYFACLSPETSRD
ncbi:MAG: methyltransferase domain-containing protein [Bryobacterales bacterium]|nr:methyltransferase domain-containing protein [Bryobacterales bacterium]